MNLKLLKSGDAAMFLDQKTKNRLRVEAQFRPNLHTIASPSLDYVAETTDAESVLKKIELTRNQDLLPLEKIQKCMESEFQCCHVERKTRGYGVNRKSYTIQCKNKAMAGNLRCPMHIGTPVTDPKNVIGLLLSQEDVAQSKKYSLLAGTDIFIPFKKEKSHQRHPMTMDILDHVHQKDQVTFKHLAYEMLGVWKKQQFHGIKNFRFPESEFRLRFGSHAPQPSWNHVSEAMKFHVCELSPKQELPSHLESYTEFLSVW